MRKLLIATILGLAFWPVSKAQSQSNIVNFTPSALFEKGQFEVQGFHSIYSQEAIRDRDGEKFDLSQRESFFNAMYQFTYGASKNGKLNVGLDVNVSRALFDSDKGSPFKVLGGASGGDQSRTVISSIGPRVKFNPIAKIPRLSVQSTFLFPVASDLESPFFVAHDRYTWFTQFFYDKSFGQRFQIFTELSWLYRINRNSNNSANFFRIPMSLFLSYFPTQKVSIFGFAQYSPRFEEVTNGFDSQFGLSQRFTQLGLGAKYQISDKLGLECSYGNFVNSRLDGAGESFNFGIRYIQR